MEGLVSRRYAGHGVELDCIEAGPSEGPLVILLHGFPEDGQSWANQVGALASAGFRVLAPDQRGYGGSDRPKGVRPYALDRLAADIVVLASSLGRAQFDVAGHDWGGVVAWWAAVRHPERVGRLAILNAPHPIAMRAYLRRSRTQIWRSAYIKLFQIPFLPEVLLSVGDFRLLTTTLVRSSRPGAFSEAALTRYRNAWRERGALTAMLNWYRALKIKPSASTARRVRARTLILWGAGDWFLERGLAAASAAMCDDAQLVYLEDATHWLLHEEGDRLSAALIDFFTR